MQDHRPEDAAPPQPNESSERPSSEATGPAPADGFEVVPPSRKRKPRPQKGETTAQGYVAPRELPSAHVPQADTDAKVVINLPDSDDVSEASVARTRERRRSPTLKLERDDPEIKQALEDFKRSGSHAAARAPFDTAPSLRKDPSPTKAEVAKKSSRAVGAIVVLALVGGVGLAAAVGLGVFNTEDQEPLVSPTRTDDTAAQAAAEAQPAVEPVEPSEAEPGEAEPGGAEPSGAEPSGAEPSRTQPSGTEPSGTEPSGTKPEPASPPEAEPEPTAAPKTAAPTAPAPQQTSAPPPPTWRPPPYTPPRRPGKDIPSGI